MKPTEKQIEEIAEDLDCGMKSLYNLKTGELKAIPDVDDIDFDADELWEDEFQEIEENRDDYFEFEKLDSNESYEIMADFAELSRIKNYREN